MSQSKNSNQNYFNLFFWLNLAAIFLGVFFAAFKFSALPNQVPLFYSRPWGEDQLAPKVFLFLIPACSLTVFLINLTTVKLLVKNNQSFLSSVSQLFALLFSFLGLIALVKIIFLLT